MIFLHCNSYEIVNAFRSSSVSIIKSPSKFSYISDLLLTNPSLFKYLCMTNPTVPSSSW